MGRFLGRKPDPAVASDSHYIDDNEYQKRDLYKKGVNHMANEKLEDAIRSFELAIRLDPEFVDAWTKKGYAHFHQGDYRTAISAYDKALEIDVNNAEGWNLKGLAYYRMRNFEKAIECCEKAVDINPNDAMSWYNKACYLTLSGRIDESMEALKRSIEIDIVYAKKAVSDRDFENARAEEGFRRIIEVVVLESIRQGYNYAGKIVWITNMDRVDVEDALMRLSLKGLVIRREKKTFTSKEEYYELAKEIADKVGSSKKTGFFGKQQVSAPLQQLKDISAVLGNARDSIEQGDVKSTAEYFEQLISPSYHGSIMIEKFFEEHRDLRLFQSRLKERGQEYLNSHKADLVKFLSDMDSKVQSNEVAKPAKD